MGYEPRIRQADEPFPVGEHRGEGASERRMDGVSRRVGGVRGSRRASRVRRGSRPAAGRDGASARACPHRGEVAGDTGAHWGAQQEYPAVWLTPVLGPVGSYPLRDDSDTLAERIRRYPADNLVVGGTADTLWQAGFRGTGKVLGIEGSARWAQARDVTARERGLQVSRAYPCRYVTAWVPCDHGRGVAGVG